MIFSRVGHTRWFKYDRDCLHLFTHKSVPVIFEPPCIIIIDCKSVAKIRIKFLMCAMRNAQRRTINGFLEDSHHYMIQGRNKRERAWSLRVCRSLYCCSTPWEEGSKALNRRKHKTYRGRRRYSDYRRDRLKPEGRLSKTAVMIINSVEVPSGQFPKTCLHSHRNTNLLHAVQKPMLQTIPAWATCCDI